MQVRFVSKPADSESKILEVGKLFEAKMAIIKYFPSFILSDLWQRDGQGFFKQVFASKERRIKVATIHFNGEA